MERPHWRNIHMEMLYLVFLNTIKKQKELLFLNFLRHFLICFTLVNFTHIFSVFII